MGAALITVDEVLSATVSRFRNRNGRNIGTGTVHAVRIRDEWMAVGRLPVPACGSGVGGVTGRMLEPTVDAVTCVHCLNSPDARAAAGLVPTPHQLPLFDQQPDPGAGAGVAGSGAVGDTDTTRPDQHALPV